jgi:predicted lipid-binding transport protein (Tim44 family)
MQRMTTVMVIAMLAFAPFVWMDDAWARAGGGSSGGSRGSRSYSAPATSSQGVSRQPAAPTSSPTPTAPQRSGWGGMIGGMVGGLLLGGLLGSLFSGGSFGGGGVGLLEIIVLAGLAFLAFRMFRGRTQAPAGPSGYATAGSYGVDDRLGSSSSASVAVEPPSTAGDLDRGLGYIRQMDPGFDPRRFSEAAQDIFFKVQAAWIGRDMGRASGIITSEMQGFLQKDCDRLRAERRINRLENIAVREAEVTEAWQERGQDYVTVHFLASLLDYTTDEQSGQVVEGNAVDPVKFEEFWTFVRPIGPNPWRLSAIQQPA